MSGNARSSHHRCSVRRGALIRNFAKSTGKHLHQSRFFNRVAGQPFLQNTSGQLLLKCLKKISKWKWWTKLLFQKSNRLMFYTSTVSYFHVSFFYIFFRLNWRFSFKLNFIPGWNSNRFIPGSNSRPNNFFHPRTSFKNTISIFLGKFLFAYVL